MSDETMQLPQVRSRSRRRTVFLVLALTAVLLALNWWQTNREMDRVLTAVEASEQSMESGAASFASLIKALPPEAVLTEQQRKEFFTGLKEAAADAAVQVGDTGAAVEDVRILPWHRAQLLAQSRYLLHSEAWKRYLSAIASDPSKYQDRAAMAQIESTFLTARRTFSGAVPSPPLYNNNARSVRIFID